jgi:hypothetical protein
VSRSPHIAPLRYRRPLQATSDADVPRCFFPPSLSSSKLANPSRLSASSFYSSFTFVHSCLWKRERHREEQSAQRSALLVAHSADNNNLRDPSMQSALENKACFRHGVSTGYASSSRRRRSESSRDYGRGRWEGVGGACHVRSRIVRCESTVGYDSSPTRASSWTRGVLPSQGHEYPSRTL